MTPPEPPEEPTPAPLQIGIQVSGADANSQAGIAARTLRQNLDSLDAIRLWSEAYTPDELEAMGMQAGTGNLFKSAMGEVPSIVAALQATQFFKKLWGTGV